MNFLSHIFLSGENPDIQVGNFIGDFVKGNKYESYERGLRQGILLHRKIDEYFDEIDLVRKMRRDLSSDYGRYSGVAVDLIFDFYLASKFESYNEKTLRAFSANFYESLSKHLAGFEGAVRFVSEKLIEYDWLYHYRTPEGMKKIAKSLERRIGRSIGFETLDHVILKNDNGFNQIFENSFSEMQLFAQKSILRL